MEKEETLGLLTLAIVIFLFPPKLLWLNHSYHTDICLKFLYGTDYVVFLLCKYVHLSCLDQEKRTVFHLCPLRLKSAL